MEPDYNFSELKIIRNPRQDSIFQRLSRLVGPGSAAFYDDACRLMEHKSLLKSTTHLVSHLLREIESSLRDVLEPFMDRTTFKNKSGEEEHKEEILAILQALAIPQNDPVALSWLGITGENNIKALYSRAHRNALELPRPFDNEFKDFWYDMEYILDKVLNLFESKYLVILNQLDDLRSKKQPALKNAKFLKNNIPSNSYAFNYFFKDLNNPAWLRPLFAEGLFSYPPEPIEHKEEGTISYPLWTLSRYLITMAPLEPDLVSNIILGIETTNGNVQADLIDAVCKLRYTLAAEHTEKISQWVKSPSIFVEHHIGKLVSYLAAGKEITSAAVLTKEFLRLRPGKLKGIKETEKTPLIHLEPLSKVDMWEYGEFLKNNYPDFLNAAPREALSLVIEVLEETLHMEGYGQTDDFQDYSGRPAIEDHDQNPNFGEPKDLLITAVRDSAVQCIKVNPKSFENILQELDTKRLSIFKRISLYLIRLFGKENIQLVENRILNRDRFYNYWTHYEYVHLIQDYFSTLSRDKQKTIIGWIREGPKTINGEEIKSIDKEYWQLQWLTILKGQLPTSWENKRLNILKKYPEPEHPDLFSWSSGVRVGPTSPLLPEQLKTMSVDDMITFLHSWKAPSGFTMDSPEGVSRSLATAISEDPDRFATDAEKFIGCDPTYVHGVFDGLRQALKPEKGLNWRPVIKLMNWVVKQEREIPGRQAGKSWDIDPDWGWTRTEMSRLLESGFNATRNQIPYRLKGSIWNILLQLTDDPNPTPDEESDTSMDPATNSLNTTRGTAFHALIAYALWVKRNIIKRKGKNDKEIDFKSDLQDVLDVLEKHLDPIYDPSPTIRAVYGICFSNLAYLDRKWVVGNKERIFPKNVEFRQYWDAAWSSFIGFNNPKPYLLQDLFTEYLFSTSIVDSTPMKAGWGNNPNERLAEHLMVYYAWNKLKLDSEIMEIFWSRSTPDLKSHAIEFIGRTGKEASTEAISRFKNLWGNRLRIASKADDKNPYRDELKAFGWWFVSEAYDDNWCLNQLEKVLHITGEIEYDHGVVERLASLSDKYPIQTIGLVEIMIEGEKKGWGILLWTESIGIILQKALSSNDANAHKAAEALINRLAARGYPDFGTLMHS